MLYIHTTFTLIMNSWLRYLNLCANTSCESFDVLLFVKKQNVTCFFFFFYDVNRIVFHDDGDIGEVSLDISLIMIYDSTAWTRCSLAGWRVRHSPRFSSGGIIRVIGSIHNATLFSARGARTGGRTDLNGGLVELLAQPLPTMPQTPRAPLIIVQSGEKY